MAEQELICNVLACRTKLGTHEKACVTTCSHIFCVACANKAFDIALVCPACETSLTQHDDIVFVDLNPSQEYRSSILSGLRPEVIMEICTRAISFWTYQTSQEAKYQEMTRKSLEDKLSLAEKQLQRMTRDVNIELSGFRDTVSALQKGVEQERRKSADLSEKLDEKTRQLSKLQALYDRQKRRPLFPDHYQQTQSQEKDVLPGVISNPYQFYQSLDTALTLNPFLDRPTDASGLQETLANNYHAAMDPSSQNSQYCAYDQLSQPSHIEMQRHLRSPTRPSFAGSQGIPRTVVDPGASAGPGSSHLNTTVQARLNALPIAFRHGQTMERAQDMHPSFPPIPVATPYVHAYNSGTGPHGVSITSSNAPRMGGSFE